MLLGDFSYPNILWDDASATSRGNAAESRLCACIRDEGIFQHVTLPARGRLATRSNILDLVITNERGMVTQYSARAHSANVTTLFLLLVA